jgi:hypothetical protein
LAQKTSWTGAALTQTDINTYLMGEGGAWSTWTPTVTQSGSVTVTVNRASYARYGRTIHATAFLTVTGAGTISNAVVIGGLPAAAAYTTGVFGFGALSDLSASRTYPFMAAFASSTSFALLGTQDVSADIQLGVASSSFTAALANTDQISFTVTYEAAS